MDTPEKNADAHLANNLEEGRSVSDCKASLIDADGYFGAGFPEVFRTKRLSLGLSYCNLARFLRVDWTTIRKWELGITNKCQTRIRPVLRNLLSGKLDEKIARFKIEYALQPQEPPALSREMNKCLTRASNALLLCQNYPELQKRMLSVFEDTTRMILDDLVNGAELSDEDDEDDGYSANNPIDNLEV